MFELAVRRDQERGLAYMMRSKQHRPEGASLIFPRPNRSILPSILKEHTQGEDESNSKEILLSVLSELSNILDQADLAAPTIACLAECYYEFDELDEAEKAARKALRSMRLSELGATIDALLPARLVLSRIQRIRGSLEAARETIREARREVIELGMPGPLIYCDAELAWLALEEGDTEPADAWERLYHLNERGELSVKNLHEHVYWAKLLMKRGRDELAWRLTGRLRAAAKEWNRFYVEVETGLMQVLLLQRSGRTDEALQSLWPILHATEPRSFRRVYLDAGESMADLISMLLNAGTGRKREAPRPSPTSEACCPDSERSSPPANLPSIWN